MSYYQSRPIRDHIQRITVEEAEQFIPLKEDYTGMTVDRCPYYTNARRWGWMEYNHVFYREKTQ
jgi:hypothetical protein